MGSDSGALIAHENGVEAEKSELSCFQVHGTGRYLYIKPLSYAVSSLLQYSTVLELVPLKGLCRNFEYF